MKIDLMPQEITTIRTALNMLWDAIIKREMPQKIGQYNKDMDALSASHKWCRIKEKDRMHDFYWIQKIRGKLK